MGYIYIYIYIHIYIYIYIGTCENAIEYIIYKPQFFMILDVLESCLSLRGSQFYFQHFSRLLKFPCHVLQVEG